MQPGMAVTGQRWTGLWASRWPMLARIGCAAVLGMAVLSFGVACLLPVYTDELGWKLMQSRMHLDALQTVITVPMCGTPAVAIPALLLPFRFVDSLLYEHLSAPGQLRASGVAIGGLGLFATALALRRTRVATPAASAVLILSFATLGIMPFLIVINRPEQILAIALLLLAIPLVFGPKPARHTLTEDAVLGVLLFLGCTFVLAEHPRGLFALPLMLVFVFRFVNRRSVAAAVSAGIVLMGAVTLQNWNARYACADPALQPVLVFDNITFAAAQGALPAYAARLWRSWLDDPFRTLFIAQFQLKDHYNSFFVPDGGGPLAAAARRIGARAFLVLLIAGLAGFGLAAWGAVRDRTARVPVLALAALWLFWAASAIGRVQKNEYEAAVMMPAIVLAALGSLWVARGAIRARIGPAPWDWLCRASFAGLIGLSVLNQAAFLLTYLPWATSSWLQPGYAKGQRFSVSVAGDDRLRQQILDTGALCGIHPGDRPRHLILDELTYYSYTAALQPYLATYIDENGWGRGVRDYRELLTRIGSQGMVTGCRWIPKELQGEAKRNGEFCCLPSFSG